MNSIQIFDKSVVYVDKMSDWNPDPNFLSEVLGILLALSDPNCEDHASAFSILDQEVNNPEFIPYLGLRKCAI